jgi:carboxymethylenebutenolidase
MLLAGADKSIAPESFDDLIAGLTARGVDVERHVYAGAPHSFFDRSFADHADACADAWTRILDFTDRHSA